MIVQKPEPKKYQWKYAATTTFFDLLGNKSPSLAWGTLNEQPYCKIFSLTKGLKAFQASELKPYKQTAANTEYKRSGEHSSNNYHNSLGGDFILYS